MQDALADELARALHLELDGRVGRALSVRPTRNLEAYQAFARGLHFWFHLTTPALLEAICCFDEAVARDPAYALAHVAKASACVGLTAAGGLVPADAWALAGEAARRAVASGPPLALAHVADAYLKLLASWDWAGAEAAMKRALEVDPRCLDAHRWNALLLCCRGRFDEAAESARRALSLDPVSVVSHGLLGLRLTLAGDDRRALDEYAKVGGLQPGHLVGHWGRGVSLVGMGRSDEGLRELRQACELSGDNPVLCTYLAWGLSAMGRCREARAQLARIESSGAAYVSPYQRAAVHVALGEPRRALACLAEAARDRDPWIAVLHVDPRLAPLRRLRAFREIEQRVFGPSRAPRRRRPRAGRPDEGVGPKSREDR
jgi:serine/threonine-protein kinase